MEFVDGFHCILGMKWNPEKMNMGNVWSLLLAQVIFGGGFTYFLFSPLFGEMIQFH